MLLHWTTLPLSQYAVVGVMQLAYWWPDYDKSQGIYTQNIDHY